MCTSVYRQYAADQTLLYVGVSGNPSRRHSEHSSRACWFDQIAHVEIEWFPSREEAMAAERVAIATEKPRHNRVLNRAGDPTVEVVDLRSWMLATGTTQALFCQIVGVGQPYLSKLMSGKQLPSIEVAWAIERATDGEVPMQHWMTRTRTPTLHLEQSHA